MENKYYTPKVEEFYVGFEYEIRDWWTREGAMGWSSNATPAEIETAKSHNPNTDGFTKRILTKSMLWEQSRTSVSENENYKKIINDSEYNPLVGTDWRHEWERITTGIKDGSVRVKCLDKEDIESLDFRKIENRDAEFGAIDAYWSDKAESILHTYPENKIRISGGVYEPRFLFFHGTIKNKSELIKIMQAVGCYPF